MDSTSMLYALDASLKATLMLALAALAAAALRRASAASRHLVWTLGVSVALAIPLLGVLVPAWELPALPRGWAARTPFVEERLEPIARTTVVPPAAALSRPALNEPPLHSAAVSTPLSDPKPVPRFEPLELVWMVWLVGAAIVALPLGLGSACMWWRGRRSRPFDSAAWSAMVRQTCAALDLRSTVRVLRSGRRTMPLAWGLVRPAVLLPEDAEEWPEERRRAVLMHELAHVKRRDCLTQAIAHVACAVYWFHPLVWLAARRLRAERERACDDLVLQAGARGPDYADHILDLARSFRAARSPAPAGVAIARPGQLEGRLLAILDASLERRAPSRPRVALGIVLVSALAVPLAGMRPVAAREPAGPLPRLAPAATIEPDATGEVAGVPAPGHARASAVAPATRSEDRHDEPDEQADQDEQGNQEQDAKPAETRADRDKVVSALSGALQDSDGEVRREAVFALGKLGSGAAAGALAAALADTDADVRQQAAFALGQIQATSAVGALAKALETDAQAGVRRQAAFALGQIGAASAVPALAKALADGDAEVRNQAAFALGQIGDETGAPALATAVSDAAPQVRKQAVFALGQIGSAGSVSALGRALSDANAEVREQAAFALGQIGDGAAVGGLVAALDDKQAGVRRQAVFALGQIGAASAVSGLRKALGDQDAEVRKQAAFALGQIGSREAVPGLLDALRDKDSNVREQAAFALGQIGDGAAVAALTQALKDADAGVRRQAAFALSQVLQ